jgi:hypothetical protein
MYNLYSILKNFSMMFYWLDSFVQYLSPFFHQVVVQTLHPALIFNTAF